MGDENYKECIFYDNNKCGIWSKNKRSGLFACSELKDDVKNYLGIYSP